MATIEQNMQDSKNEIIPYWKLAREGIALLLNNKQEEAENMFKLYPESLEMNAGYTYALFTDALMSFEEDKIQIAFQSLKDLEKKCSSYYSSGWIKSVKSKVFGTDYTNYQKELESQIILADTHVFVATLTFLQQDITGFIKGSWILRKAFKHYQYAYNAIQESYKEIVGDINLHSDTEPQNGNPDSKTEPEKSDADQENARKSAPSLSCDLKTDDGIHVCSMEGVRSIDSEVVITDHVEAIKVIEIAGEGKEMNESEIMARDVLTEIFDNVGRNEDVTSIGVAQKEAEVSKESSVQKNSPSSLIKNGYSPSYSLKSPKHSISCHSGLSSYASLNQKPMKNGCKFSFLAKPSKRDPVPSNDDKFRPYMKKSNSMNSDLSVQMNRRVSSLGNSFSYFTSTFNLFNNKQFSKNIDQETITRLLCAVSFGYGLLQLGMSLLPPSMLKLVNFLGLGGSRKAGLENLMYARKGRDMRAPFATLALLWFHTIVRPFFALDGHNVQAGVQAAADLIEETKAEFSQSALFLFFKGRVERLRGDIPAAIAAFQSSVSKAAQREIRILSMHEVGWCYLIELNYPLAESTLSCLKQSSRWSKPFYSYLTMVSAGANNTFQETQNVTELRNVFVQVPKGTQLDEFLNRRYKVCPTNEETLKQLNPIFWKILAYELLYLWNTLPSCNRQNLDKIIEDCQQAWERQFEPFLGLAKLIEGSCHCILGRIQCGIGCFRDCVEARKDFPCNSEDAHVSAFAQYELGLILIKDNETSTEGKQLLEFAACNYKGYDFEQRLIVRVHAVLRNTEKNGNQ